MKIEITNQELHEILTGLSVGRCRIRGRLNRTKRQLAEFQQNGGDEGRELYLTSIIQLREIRIETINKIIEKLESYETD